MIFVIIGIVILIISFIIALQSLLKEQHKAGQLSKKEETLPEEPERESEKINQEPTSVLSKEAQEILRQSPVQPSTPSQNLSGMVSQGVKGDEDKSVDESREPFPWEKEFGDTDAIKKTETEEDKIERLRSQLEQIKATKGVAKTFQPQELVEDTKKNIISSSKGLNGEISLRDLQKKST